MKKTAFLLLSLAFMVIIIPMAIVAVHTQKVSGVQRPSPQKALQQQEVTVPVYRAADRRTRQVDFNDYLIGVVGSEMPASFKIEALKAQAMAARTYIMAHMLSDEAAPVTDTVRNQVFHNTDELKQLWGKDYEWKIKKIRRAVAETENKVITYKGKLISPVFFSTSNGQTENAGDYWASNVPYLRSVASPWDRQSPKFKNKKTVTRAAFEQALGVSVGNRSGAIGRQIRKTATGHVAHIDIAGKSFTGRQIREKLHLSSTDFRILADGDHIRIDSVGSGHDVGMSQYGAEGMAAEGKSAEQIVTYFYQGTEVSELPVTALHASGKK